MARGGKRLGAGRKSKQDEDKANKVFLNALKTIYNTDTDEQTKEKFVIDLAQNIRGKMFIAEHLFGKPKESIEMLGENKPILIDFTTGDAIDPLA